MEVVHWPRQLRGSQCGAINLREGPRPTNKDMGFIAKSAFPLFLLMILAVVVIIIFPDIALWLPEQMIQTLK